MKKEIIKVLIVAMSVAFAGVGSVGAQPAHGPRGSGRPSSPNYNHNSHSGYQRQYRTSDYRYYSYRPAAYPYRYGYYGRPYYSMGYSPYYYGNYGYYGYGYGYPGISVNYTIYADSDAPGYAVGGAVLGGVLGGIISNNSYSRNPWAGVAIGSTIGLLAGSAADNAAVRRQRAEFDAAQTAANNSEIARVKSVTQSEMLASQESQAPRKPTPAPVPVTPMSQANALFGR